MMPFIPQSRGFFTKRSRGLKSRAVASVISLLQRISIAVVGIAGIAGLVFVSFNAKAPRPVDPPGAGIVAQTEVTVLWLPRALRDFAQSEAISPRFGSPEALQTELTRRGMNNAWYALTYRGYSASGEFEDVTQIRRLREAAAHFDEFQSIMATAAGNPNRSNVLDFSHARVETIPDALQAVDPREAITALISNAMVIDTTSPTQGPAPLDE